MKSGAHHNKGSHLGNTHNRHLETASAHCRSILLFIFVQMLKREPVLLNTHQVPIRLPSAAVWLLRNHGFQKVKAVRHVYPEEAKSSEARSLSVLYNIIQSGFKLEVKLQFWTHIYDETEICWGSAVALTSVSIPFLWPSYNDSVAKYMHTINTTSHTVLSTQKNTASIQ